MLGVEGVLHPDGDVFDAHRIDGGRIDHLRTEVTQLHGLDIRQLVDGVGRLDDAGVGRHKAIHVRPYFQYFGIEGRSDDGCGVVRAATPQVGGLVGVAVAGDEARNHGHGGLRGVCALRAQRAQRGLHCLCALRALACRLRHCRSKREGLLHQLVRQFGIEHVLALLLHRTDEVT